MADRLTDDQIAVIRARHEAATPGPWRFCYYGFNADYRDGDVRANCQPPNIVSDASERDGVFIAHARQDIPALLAHAAALEAEVAGLRQVSAELCEACGWAMRFPCEPCRNCECARLEAEIASLRAALETKEANHG